MRHSQWSRVIVPSTVYDIQEMLGVLRVIIDLEGVVSHGSGAGEHGEDGTHYTAIL